MASTTYRAGEGEPLVLIHGFTSTQDVWKPVLPALEARHEVLAPTLPGHFGGDPWPEGVEVSAGLMADSVERAMDEAGMERAHIAGNSLGGWLALELGARGRATSVVALCPAGGWEPGGPEERAIVRFFRFNDFLLRYGARTLRFTASRPRLRRLALRELVARPERVDATAALGMFEGAAGCAIVSETLSLTGSGGLFGELEEITCPVRIAYGTNDRIIRWPACYQRMRRLLPDVEYVALEGMGHMPMWDDPDLSARTVLEVTAERAGTPA
jgi:pimeloyl-ACP methyl ester carboxylesterase